MEKGMEEESSLLGKSALTDEREEVGRSGFYSRRMIAVGVILCLVGARSVLRSSEKRTTKMYSETAEDAIMDGLETEIEGALAGIESIVEQEVLEDLGLGTAVPSTSPTTAPPTTVPTHESISKKISDAISAAVDKITGDLTSDIMTAVENSLEKNHPDDLDLEIIGEYPDVAPGSRYRWISPNDRFYFSGGIIEPYRTTTLFIVNTVPRMNYVVNMTIETTAGALEKKSFCCGPELSLEVSSPNAKINIEVFEFPDTVETSLVSASLAQRTLKKNAIVKYVRREIRTLNDDDRTAFFDAMKVTYRMSTEVGQRVYNNRYYRSAYDYAEFHNTLSGQRDCDHLHGGMGFLTQHAAFTHSYERSLQAVNHKVTMPYWDYSIDQEAATVYDNPNSTTVSDVQLSSFYASTLFSQDFYGSVPGDETNHVVRDGQFSHLSIPSGNLSNLVAYWGLDGIATKNAYGLLRSPWNGNPVPFVSRHNTSYGFALDGKLLPGCNQMYQQMTMPFWQQFASTIEDSPHGSLHIAVGGTWGADYASSLTYRYNYSYSKAEDFATIALVRIWRLGYIDCPDYCSSDTSPSDCKCTCPHLKMWLKENKTEHVLEQMMPNLAEAPKFGIAVDGEDVTTALLRMLCNDYPSWHPQIGDFFQSSSPIDPLFWPTHPTLDRLWHWRANQGFADSYWGDNVSTCWGHREDDVTVWSASEFDENLDPDSDTGAAKLTNAQLYTIFSGDSDTVPYVYDTFEWEHCTRGGYPHDLVFSEDADVSSTGNAITDDNDPLASASDGANSATRNIQNSDNQ